MEIISATVSNCAKTKIPPPAVKLGGGEVFALWIRRSRSEAGDEGRRGDYFFSQHSFFAPPLSQHSFLAAASFLQQAVQSSFFAEVAHEARERETAAAARVRSLFMS